MHVSARIFQAVLLRYIDDTKCQRRKEKEKKKKKRKKRERKERTNDLESELSLDATANG